MKYTVIVDCTNNTSRPVIKTLKKLGLRWVGNNKYTGSVNKKRYEQIASYCNKKHLRYRINNGYGTRSTDYRQQFFKRNPPVWHNRYFCAYCGKLIPRRYLTVDHLYPIGKANKSIDLQRKLRSLGIKNINDPKNLVGACKNCNSKKGKKMGLWIIRGKIGRYPEVWMIRHFIRLIVFTIVLYWLISGEFMGTLTAIGNAWLELVSWFAH